jgi:MFS family permease
MFLVSLCTDYWQVLLCQGIGIGIGIGLVYLPSISIVSQYFSKRRALAIGIALTGSSGGGIVFPIMLNNLIISHGFKRAVQYQGYLVLGFLILSNLLMRPRPRAGPTTTSVTIPKSSVKSIITEKPYALLVFSICLITWGFFFPPFFLQVRS